MALEIEALLLRKLVGNEYAIGEVLSASLFSAGNAGESGATIVEAPLLKFREVGGTIFLLQTELGQFALKVYSTEQLSGQCLLEASLMAELPRSGFSLVPNVICTKSGALLGTIGERKCLLLQYIPCTRELNWTSAAKKDAECVEAGKVLARLHATLSGFADEFVSELGLSKDVQPSSVGRNGKVGVSSIRPYLHGWLCSAFALVAGNEHKMNDQLKQSTIAKQELALKIAENAEKSLVRADSANLLLVHGDFHTGNLIWRNETVLAVIDFENAHYEHPLYDVAYAIIMFTSNWASDDRSEPFNMSLGRLMLENYLSEANLVTESEVEQLLPAYIQLTGVLILMWVLHDCVRSQRFERQLKFLLAHIQDFKTMGGSLVQRQRRA